MVLPSPRSLLLGALALLPSLPAMASAHANYTSYSQADMLRAQVALFDSRPPDCPPWYVPRLVADSQRPAPSVRARPRC